MVSRYMVFASAGLWLALFVLSFVTYSTVEPTGDGFTRGMDRAGAVLAWQAGAMVAALLAGVFTTFAASQLRPVFHDVNDLRTRVELPILGVVTRLVTDADRARVKVDLVRFAAGAGGLLMLFAVALTILAVQLSRQVV